MKKFLALFLALAMAFSLVACGNAGGEGSEGGDDSAEATNYKIGIMCDTVTQGEEVYRTAMSLLDEYGEDRIVVMNYPDKAASEQETTLSTMLSLAADPDVKAIVACFANEGTIAAFKQVKEARPDMLLIGCAPTEDPFQLAEIADIVLGIDYVQEGAEVAETANKMGAKTLVHYSFPRHMANPIYLARHDVMQAKCEELGIQFVDGTAPDPQAEGGLSATQQFILEDVPRKVSEHGADTAFFSTNIGMHEPMIKMIYETVAIFPHNDSPSPFSSFPGALGIEVPDEHAGDAAWMCEQISAKLTEKGLSGRMGTWTPAVMPMIMRSAVTYAMKWYESGNTDMLVLDIFEEVVSSLSEGRYTLNDYVDPDASKVIPDNYKVLFCGETTLL